MRFSKANLVKEQLMMILFFAPTENTNK